MKVHCFKTCLLFYSWLLIASAFNFQSSDYMLSYSLLNNQEDWIKIPIVGTPFDSQLRTLQLQYEDEDIEYDGLLRSRSFDPSSTYIILGPGESITTQIKISEAYNLQRKGQYNISTRSNMNASNSTIGLPAILSTELWESNFTKERTSSGENISITAFADASNIIQVVLNEDDPTPPPTIGEQLRSHQDKFNNLGMKIGENITKLEEKYLTRAHYAARELVKKAQEYLKAQDELFKKWFADVKDPSPWKSNITYNFDRINNLSFSTTYYKGWRFECTSNWYSRTNAFTYKHSSTVFVCDPFFADTKPLMGVPDALVDFGNVDIGQALILIHEFAHAYLAAEDESGNRYLARYYAKFDPTTARNNANNYAFFVNNLPAKISLHSIFGHGIRSTSDSKLFSDDQVKKNIEFICEGEFPDCKLKVKDTNTYLDYDTWSGDLKIGSDSPTFAIRYEGNGAYSVHYRVSLVNRIALNSASQLVKTTSLFEYDALWLVTIDDWTSNVRTVNLKSTSPAGYFKIEERTPQVNSLVTCDPSDPTTLELQIIGPNSRCVMKVNNVKTGAALFLNDRFLTSAVKLYDQPFYFVLNKNSENAYLIESKEKYASSNVYLYCQDWGWNKYQVFDDGSTPTEFIVETISIGSDFSNIKNVDSSREKENLRKINY